MKTLKKSKKPRRSKGGRKLPKKGKLPIKDRTYPGGPKINKDGVPEDGGWAL